MKPSAQPRRAKILFWGTIVWAVAIAALLVFYPDAYNFSRHITVAAEYVILATGFLLFGFAFFVYRRPVLALICILLTAAGTVFYFNGGHTWGEKTRFALHRSGYEAQVAAIEKALKSGGTHGELPPGVQADPGPPVRVAFPWKDGVKTWNVLVYDPSGVVTNVNRLKRDGANAADPEIAAARGLFSGHIAYAKPLAPNWYFCVCLRDPLPAEEAKK
jgi:hypothetical protein